MLRRTEKYMPGQKIHGNKNKWRILTVNTRLFFFETLL